MAKLSTVESLRNRLGAHDLGPINESISEALESASAQLSTHLNTRFDRGQYVDYFKFTSRRQPYVGEYLLLAPRNGFILRSPNPTFRIGPSLSSVINVTDPYARHAAIVGGDYAAGKLIIPDQDLYRYMSDARLSYGALTYSAGFEVEDAYGLYKGVPGWLQELSEIWAAAIYNKKAENLNDEYRRGEASILSIKSLAEPYRRNYPATFRPIV